MWSRGFKQYRGGSCTPLKRVRKSMKTGELTFHFFVTESAQKSETVKQGMWLNAVTRRVLGAGVDRFWREGRGGGGDGVGET